MSPILFLVHVQWYHATWTYGSLLKRYPGVCKWITFEKLYCDVPQQCVMMTVIFWWRHQMETFAALLAICAGNSPVSGEFPAQRPVTRSFDVFFDLRLKGRLSKHSWGWWLETPSWPLWRQSNVLEKLCNAFSHIFIIFIPDIYHSFYITKVIMPWLCRLIISEASILHVLDSLHEIRRWKT